MPLYLQTDADPGTASWGSALAQGVGTHAQLLAITGQSAGDLFYDITFGKLWAWTGLSWQVSGETVELVNDTGGPLRAGDVVIIDTTLDRHVATQTVADADDTLGVIAIDIPDTGTGSIAVSGTWNVAFIAAQNVTPGVAIRSSGTAARAEIDTSAPPGAGWFCSALTTTTTVANELVPCIVATNERF
jgi:hypothetical protein